MGKQPGEIHVSPAAKRGIAVFVIKATLPTDSPVTLNDIFAGAFPFAVIMFLVLLLVIAFPWLATALV